MGIPGSANPMLLAGAAGAYQIDQSLRFNSADSARLYRTLAASQTRTYSFWYKYANLSGGNMYLFHHKNSGDTNYLGVRSGGSPSENQWQTLNQGSSYTEIASSRKYRDPSAWQHVLWKCTSTNVTMYVNGVEFASTGGANTSLSGGTLEIGARGSAEYFGGYIAEFHFVDGTAYNPSDFGETDTITGAWIPKRFAGTYGSNGAYLKFDPSATNGIGHDHSGNGNNFTATGFSTSGTGTDVMSDTPTNNWCTLNPVFNTAAGSITSDGNLKASFSSDSVTGTFGPASGKWYFEVTVDSITTNAYIGIADQTLFVDTSSFSYSQVYVYLATAVKGGNGSTSSYGATYGAGDVIGVAYNLDAGEITFYKNGVSQGVAFNSGFGSGYNYRPFSFSQGGGQTFNFGQRAFAYTPPTGFKALNTANLPEPTIKDGSKYFDTKLYSGTSASQSITGLGFSPDFVWIKSRNEGYAHYFFDAVRTAGKYLTNNTNAETTDSTTLSSFDSAGFSLGSAPGSNNSGGNYVAWAWDANGAGSSNTAGSITSTVSANATAGFSIVTYTGLTYTGNAANDTGTVGHGLGVAPSFIIIKSRTSSSDWICYHQATGNTKLLWLNLTNAAGTNSSYQPWASTSPTSTVFTVGPYFPTYVASNKPMVAYCFSEVAGYSKFGSYTGNGSTDGTFIYTGFRPAFVLIKKTDSATDWHLYDSARIPYNAANVNPLYPNQSWTEGYSNNQGFDLLSNGFKPRSGAGVMNGSGGSYIFAAFAEHPFKYANAR